MADLPTNPNSREEQYLASISGQDVETPACPYSRKEAYLEAIDERVESLQEELETLENNPDVADIVDTYADLQAYDTSKLTDKDIIRVLNDETHDGNSTYYRYDKDSTSSFPFDYIGSSKTYDVFTGTDGTTAGQAGLVPAPATTDAGKFLKADGTWDDAGSAVNIVQTTGTSTTDVMSQNAVTGMVYADPANKRRIAIGGGQATFDYSTAVGGAASAQGNRALAVGYATKAYGPYSIALGTYAEALQAGQMDISTGSYTYGYNNSNYRLLTGVYDGQSAHDAATVGQTIGTTETLTIADTDWTALSSSDPYDYSATVTATATINANTGIVELINDQAVLFATYGFAIGAVDTTNNTVTIYSIGEPTSSVSLNIKVRS